MSATEALRAKAQRHWTKYLPEKTRELRAAGLFESELNHAAHSASEEIAALMRSGFQEHEAEEVVLPQWILLPPEQNSRVPAGEKTELNALERRYQKMMAGS